MQLALVSHSTNIIFQWRDEWKPALVVSSSPATRIQPTQMLLDTPESLLDQSRLLHILSEEVGSCSNQHQPLWQMPNNVTYCQQLSTVQARGGCSDCTQMMTLPSVL